MKIKYTKRFLRVKLFVGLLFLANAVYQTFFSGYNHWFNYSFFVIAMVYLIGFAYQKTHGYLLIENDVMKQNWPFGKEIRLSDIKRIRHSNGAYLLMSEEKKFNIDLYPLTPESKKDLKSILENLEVQWVTKPGYRT